MKSFKTYLFESQKTYEFKVRVAGDVKQEHLDKFKKALEAYGVDKVGSVKRLPIQETSVFPNMGPIEVSIFEVSVCYPANDDQIRNTIAECGCFAAACIKVTPANSPYEAVMTGTEVSNKDGKPGEAVLLQDDMKAEPLEADLVGDERVPSLIKELEETRKYEYPEAAGGKTPEAKTTNEIPTGNSSPVGSNKNKIPVPKKMSAGNGR